MRETVHICSNANNIDYNTTPGQFQQNWHYSIVISFRPSIERMQRILEQKEIEELKYRNKNILLHFVTEWCNPCKLSRKLLEAELPKCSNDLVLAEVNCDEAEELVLDYRIEGVPTFILLDRNLKPINRMMGFLPERVKSLLKKPQGQP